MTTPTYLTENITRAVLEDAVYEYRVWRFLNCENKPLYLVKIFCGARQIEERHLIDIHRVNKLIFSYSRKVAEIGN